MGKVATAYNCNSSQQLQQFLADNSFWTKKKDRQQLESRQQPTTATTVQKLATACNSYKVYNSCQGLPPVWAWLPDLFK